MFYDPTPPLSSSWSEWPGRFNMSGNYEDEEWDRPLGGHNRSYSNPRLRRFDIMDDSPRVSRTSSRSEEMNSEVDENAEPENSRPPRVHRIPIFVEERQSSQESAESPDAPEVDEIKKEWEASHGNNTVPRFRRRNFGSEDDLQRSRSHTTAFQRPRGCDSTEPQPVPRRRRPNVTKVKINCDEDQPPQLDPKKEQLSVIESVVREVDELKKQVKGVSGTESKHCRYLDEMLTRCMLKLDDVNTMGEEDIRLARKSAIYNVQSCIDLLESKLHPPPPVQKEIIKSPEPTDKVIVLPYYEPESQEVTSKPEADGGSQRNGVSYSDKNVVVLPCNEEGSKSPEKTVIVLPYRDTPVEKDNDTKDTQGQKFPEKTVIVLPYHEKAKDDMETGAIPLPYYDTDETNSNDSMCTKL